MSYTANTDDQVIDQRVGVVTDNAYLHTREVAFVYPALQAIGAGVFVALFVLTLWLVAGWPKHWEATAIAFTGVQMVAWFYSLYRWNRWVYKIEGWTGLDINQDTYVGQPEPVQTIRIISPDGTHETIARLPGAPEKLKEFATGLVHGVPLTVDDWTGSGRPFSKREYKIIIDEMLARGLAEMKNPSSTFSGTRLTRTGAATMRDIAGVRLSELQPPR